MDDFHNTIAEIIERRRDESRINPSWVANEAMKKWDPGREAHPCIYHGSFEHAKDVAREQLRDKFNPVESDAPQHELFTELQWRYPVARDDVTPRNALAIKLLEEGKAKTLKEARKQATLEIKPAEPAYVLLENMSEEDFEYNMRHMLKKSVSLVHHVDALQSYRDDRRRRAKAAE